MEAYKRKFLPHPLPPMGWNSYCTVNCEPTQELILQTADAMVELGLREAGYLYVNIDDGWLMPERDADGKLVESRMKFPDGMRYVTDYIHARGLKAGTYLGCGFKTWNGDAGTLGHEFEDARQVAEWGFDYIKYDRHPMSDDPPRDTIAEYIKMGVAIRDCGRDILYNMCEHGTTKPWNWAAGVGQTWRTGQDVRDEWEAPGGAHSITEIADYLADGIVQHTRAGNFNDPDMLVCGMHCQNDWMGPGCTDTEYRTQFALWCLMAAPLMIGADIRHLNDANLQILKHQGMIAIDQDPLCAPVCRAVHIPGEYDVWVRPLSGIRWAVGLFNRSTEVKTIGFAYETLGITNAMRAKITDVWSGDEMGIHMGSYETPVQPHETKVLTVQPVFN